jgi:3-oxoacyl-[acyl-carrier-protein] synthase-3
VSRALASILGTGSYVPAKILSNEELAKTVDTTDEWIRSRTGIAQRHIAAADEQTSDMGFKAAEKALAQAGLAASELDAIICATLSPDYPWPATACLIQRKLNAPQALAFDLSAACSGLVYAMAVAEGLIAAGTAKHVLVVGAEKLSSILDWSDRNSCVLFGDGAGAMVLGPANGHRVLRSMTLGADGSQVEKLYQPGGGTACPASLESVAQKLHFLKMEGKEVYKFAVKIMGEASAQAVAQAGWKPEEIDLFVPHQANIRIIESAAKFMGLPMDRVFVNLDKYGNTSAASVGLALDEAVRSGRVKAGDKLVLVAFGAGLTWAATAIEW